MLTDYIREAMRLAQYELMENERFFATIPGLKGLWAEDATLNRRIARHRKAGTMKMYTGDLEADIAD